MRARTTTTTAGSHRTLGLLVAASLLLAVSACDTGGVATGEAYQGPWIISTSGENTGGHGPGTPRVDDPEHLAQSLAALTAVDDCDDLEAELRAAALAEMELRVDEALEQAIQYGPCSWRVMEDGDYAATGGGGPPAPNAQGGESASEYSTTNNQVVGVDEADFVKNDGSYIYILADGRFQIIDAWPAEEAHVLSSRGIEGDPTKLFVSEGVAVIYSALAPLPRPDTDPWGYGSYGPSYDRGGGECTYGYDCDFTGDGRAFKITMFDLSDVANPVLVREIELSGSYINSRRVGAAVHTVAFFPGAVFPGVHYYPEDLWNLCEGWDWEHPESVEAQIRAAFDALREENRQAIAQASIVDFLPGIRDTRYVNGAPVTEEGLLERCDHFYVSQQDHGDTFLAMLSFDMTELGAIDATTILGKPGAVYASGESLYVSARHQQTYGSPWFYGEGEDAPEEASTVHKFHLLNDPPRTFYAGSGVVKGRVLNQFAMDEYEGYLRIATTTGHLPSPDAHNTLTVLGEHSGALVQAGQVDHIAPSEDIRSVRFAGPRGYIVTFKKTDPLFVIDLADPERPEIAGELKIPGFSTYMHVLDPDHVLSIGYDADDQGDFAWFQGIMLQIFDVSDMRDPRLVHKEVIGSRGSTSEAATNHMAFTYFRERDLLAVPMTVCEGGHGGSYGERMSFSGLMVYRVRTTSGFDYLGGVSHQMPESENDYWGACNSWWTDSSSLVLRSIFMENYVYSITPSEIRVDSVDHLGVDLAVVPLVREDGAQ